MTLTTYPFYQGIGDGIEQIELYETVQKLDFINREENRGILVTKESINKSVVIFNEPLIEDLETIYSIFQEYSASRADHWKKVAHIVMKTFLSIICYVSMYPSLASSKKNFNSVILQNIFAYGNAFAWGSVAVYCGLQIYYDFIEDDSRRFKKITNKHSLIALAVYWPAVITLALLSELPLAYTSYFYNDETPFWCVFSPLIASFFAMLSNHQLFTGLISTNYVLKTLCLKSSDAKLVRAHDNFCKLIQYSYQSLSKNKNETLERKVEGILSSDLNKKVICSELILEILQEGLKEAQKSIDSKSRMIYFAESGIKIISSILPIGSPIVDGILIYKGFHLIFNQNWPIPFIILLAVGPGVYLQIKLTQDFYTSLFNHSIGLRNCNREQIDCKTVTFTLVKTFLIGVFTILGLAGDTTVARDHVGFDNVFKVLIVISFISTMAIILLTSMNSMANDLNGFYQKWKRSVEQIKYDKMLKGIGHLEEYFRSIPKEKFEVVLKEINANDSVITILKEKDFKEMILPNSNN